MVCALIAEKGFQMKKTAKVVVAIILFVSLATGIGFLAQTRSDSSKPFKIVTTVFPAYDFTRAVVGDNANISLLVPPGSETHSYEPSPQDISAIQQCDLFIYVGGESESWVDKITIDLDKSKTRLIKMLDVSDALEEEIVEGMESNEHIDEAEYDEHVWTSPLNAIKIVNAIRDAVTDIDLDNADIYRSNADNYTSKLRDLDQDFRTMVEKSKRHLIIFGDRFPFRYLTEEYGLQYFAAFPGCSEQTEASAATIAFLISKINSSKLHYIFTVEFSNQEIAKTIAAETGAEILELHSLHNVSKADFDSGKTYLEIMRTNLDNLEKALN